MIESALVALKEPMQSLKESFVVPKTYPELQKRFGPHIIKLLQRHNEYPGNFEDLHHYVWQRLLEARLLERFEEYLNANGVKVLTVLQVCDFLGVSWQQWVDACVASHTGDRPYWMPTPVNVAEYRIEGIDWYDSPTALFAFADIVKLEFGVRVDGVFHWPFEDWGQEVIDGVVVGESRPEGDAKFPLVSSTESHFKNYLNRAVLNSHHNFCRTVQRRHKERPQSPQGSEGHMTPWEDTLVEPNQDEIEVALQASELHAMVTQALHNAFVETGVPAAGDEGRKVWALLLQGISIQTALKQCGVPQKLRKTVISTIHARRFEAVSATELD